MTFLSINQINYALNGILKKENLSSDTKISIRILYNEITFLLIKKYLLEYCIMKFIIQKICPKKYKC
jgi:hypothetical protein